MAMIQCIECGQMVSDKAEKCPNCGYPIGLPVANQVEAQTSSNSEVSEKRKRQVHSFLIENKDKLPTYRMEDIRQELLALSESQWEAIEYTNFKNPTTLLVVSLLVGGLGVDRFMLGDTLLGLLKLLLSFCCGIGTIWWLIDLYNLHDTVTNYNYKKLREVLELS